MLRTTAFRCATGTRLHPGHDVLATGSLRRDDVSRGLKTAIIARGVAARAARYCGRLGQRRISQLSQASAAIGEPPLSASRAVRRGAVKSMKALSLSGSGG